MADNRYRKIEVRMWGDEKFRALTGIQPSGQALWIYLLTGPHTGPIPGLFRAGRAGIAEELGWSLEAFDEAFREVFALDMLEADWKARVVFIPKAIKCNPPQSPNVVTGWAGEWRLIPECELKRKAHQVLKSAVYECGEAFAKAFAKAFPNATTKTSLNQEQEQEQEQNKRSDAAASAATAAVSVLGLPLNDGTEYQVMPDSMKEWSTLYPAVDVLQELRNMRGWLVANQRNRKTKSGILRFVMAWLSKEQNRAPRVATGDPTPSPQGPKKKFEYLLPPDLDFNAGNEVWRATLSKMAERINKHTFETWLQPTQAVGIRNNVLYVKVPTIEFLYIGDKFGSLLHEVLPEVKVELVAPREISQVCSENPSRLAPVSYSPRRDEVSRYEASSNR